MSKRHEMLLFRYSSALERGDFDTIAALLREAEHDPALEEMIVQINEVYAAEQSERFNHTNHKEIPMIAPLYQNRKQANVRSHNLLLIAAFTLVAVIGVTVAVRLPINNLLNSGQDGSPVPVFAQIDPSQCVPFQSAEEGRIKIYSRPSVDSPFAYTAYTSLYIPASNISQLDAVAVDGQTWYYVRIASIYRDTMQGWMLAEEFNRNVTCAPLVNPTVMAQAQDYILSLTATPTPAPFVWTEPTTVPPANIQALSTFTPAPSNLPNATNLPATVVPPEQPLTMPTVVPAEGWTVGDGVAQYVFPERCKATTRAAAEVRSIPSWDSEVLFSIPRGTAVNTGDYAVSVDGQGRRETWYFGAMQAGTGWVLASLLDAAECPPVPSLPRLEGSDTTTLLETPVPFQLEATIVRPEGWTDAIALPPTVAPPEVNVLPTIVPAEAVAAPDFPVYIVQEGDTILSILARFNFDASALRDFSIVNQLPEDAVLTPGQAVLLPYNMPDLLTTCTIVPEQLLGVRAQPSDAEYNIITTLPAGTTFEITGETQGADGIWVSISARVGNVTISGGWVPLNSMDFVSECRTDIVPTVEAAAVQATPTPIPLLPSLTPTPAPSSTPTPAA